jgi:hypothetical protein
MRNSGLLAYVALVATGGGMVYVVYTTLAPFAAALPRTLGVLFAGG